MVVRELKDGRSYVSLQEDHAELAAQFAAHWGNQHFSRLRPYQTMVFATTYHDSGYREFEGNPPMNVEKGRPYAHREEVPDRAEGEVPGHDVRARHEEEQRPRHGRDQTVDDRPAAVFQFGTVF